MSKHLLATSIELTTAEPGGTARRRAASDRALRYAREHWLTAAEIAVIMVWAVVVTRPYLNFDKAIVPAGREYLFHLSTNHFWTRVQACGLCALWNGSVRGGYPALADVQTSLLHPLVSVPTLLFGVINGGKVTLLLAFFTAGLAQWWLGRTLRLPRPVGLWTALMAVAGGHLAGRMDGGVPGLVLALASCSLALAASVAFVERASRRSAVLLGVAFALAIVAGQGYVQIGFLLLLPLLAILIVGGPAPAAVVVRRLLVAAVLGLLLAAPLVVPVLHFLPELAKGIDGQFATAQPLKFTALNLLVDDAAFYRTEILGKMAFPAIYAHFIGWIPLVLAIWGLGSRRVTGSARHGLFLGATALGALWLATASPFAWLARTFSSAALQNFIMGVRFTPLFIGLAVPPILALAGIGVARLLLLSWPRFSLGVSGAQDKPASFFELNTQVLLVIPLVLALAETYSFGRAYIYSAPVIHGVEDALDALKTPDLQWVDTPYGEQFWMEAAAALGLKVSTGTQGWSWANREPPLPVRTLSRGNPPPGMTTAGVAGGLNLYASGPGREYAVVSGADGRRFACQAHGAGGDITVSCEAPAAGMLTVAENVWPGWQARVDGQAVPLYGQPFIALPLRPGAHTVSLKYRPYDVPAGGLLFLVGIVWAAYLWFVKDAGPHQVTDSTRSDEPPAVDGAG